jgi:uncharacterized damage-inducible protein DinB
MFLVRTIIEYAMWANTKIWNVVEQLTDEEFVQVLGEDAGSIRRRYVHLAQDTWEWFHDWHSEKPKEPDFLGMTRNELYHFMMDYMMKWKHLIDERSVDFFNDERNEKIVTITFDEMIFHLVNHHTYHRGQIVMGLRLLGKEIQMTDYIPYRLEIV